MKKTFNKGGNDMKMKDRNELLRNSIGSIASTSQIKDAQSIKKEDSTNIEGFAAYSIDDEIRLLMMLNTLKLKPQFYRDEGTQLSDLRECIYNVGMKDPYLLAQIIVWSRCLGEGMRSINHVAAALAAPFISGKPYAKAFYGLFDKNKKRGGVVFRVDDMSEIKDAYVALSKSVLSNSMKKGFASALVNLDTYQLAKYKKTVIDIANLVHPDIKKSNAYVNVDGKKMSTIDALLQGINVTADTWESAQSDAGQIVAQAVREGKITEDEAKVVLKEAKADNWKTLIDDNRLGIIAALRNIRNILSVVKDYETIDKLCNIITDVDAIKKNLVLPIYFDLAYTIVKYDVKECEPMFVQKILNALTSGYELSIPNLKAILTGSTCVIVDCSGSMGTSINFNENSSIRSTGYSAKGDLACSYKAGLIAATIAKATNATVIQFGDDAREVRYDSKMNVFDLAKGLGRSDMGWTDLSSAFQLITNKKMKFDRIIIVSDNEINNGSFGSKYYKDYVLSVCSPYVYVADLAAYGTVPVAGDKVKILFGYGSELYNSIKENEFNAYDALEKVKKVIIDENYTSEAA